MREAHLVASLGDPGLSTGCSSEGESHLCCVYVVCVCAHARARVYVCGKGGFSVLERDLGLAQLSHVD